MTTFFRLSGGGNDFLAFVEPQAPLPPERVRAWCRRGVSLGADGVLVLHRLTDGLRLDYRNADGGEAALCLNGARCAARLAIHLGWSGDAMVVVTGAGPLRARACGADRIELEVPVPEAPPCRLELDLDGTTVPGWFQQVGVPHLILPWEHTMASAPVTELGAKLRHHPKFAADGTNVDFVRFTDPDRLEIRSFERGVEAETLACGTGVLAAAAVGVATGRASLPLEALTRGGFELRVAGEVRDGRIVRWTLAGDARVLSEGTLLAGADRSPSAPLW